MKPHKHKELIKAWADGHTIQLKRHDGWVDEINPSWNPVFNYRIKPKEKVVKVGMDDDDDEIGLFEIFLLAAECDAMGGDVSDLVLFARSLLAKEREACAKVCESMRPSEQEYDQRFYTAATLCANAIRARGE